jgi:hypothetical protein
MQTENQPLAPMPGITPDGSPKADRPLWSIRSTGEPTSSSGFSFLRYDGSRGCSEVFSGKDSAGRPLEGQNHTYFLPTDEDRDGRLDHLTLVAAGGSRTRELQAMDQLRQIKSREREDSGHPLRVLPLGLGRVGDHKPSLLRASKVWLSVTPFVALFSKPRGTKRDARLACSLS